MGIRKRRARKHSRTHVVGFGIAGIFGFLVMLMGALAISLTSLISAWLQELPDYTSADAYLVAEPTQILASDNTVVAEYYLQNRRSVEMSQVSDYVLKGIVDTEDVRFYKHNGVDPQGIVRAVAVQLTGGSEGASTITQQLVRNTVLSDEQFEQTLKRKVREAYIAIQMEKSYTKDQILMMYLNTIYFGHQAYGIEAASVTYFNKHASELTLAEAALLCGLPQSPSAYDPFVYPELAKERRNVVLDRMLSAGDITQEEHDAAQAEEVNVNEGTFSEADASYPYFTDYVRQLLLEDFDQDTVMQGGLKVYTTLDTVMQEQAQEAVSGQLDEIGNEELDAALVAVDNSTGYVKAIVGGRNYDDDEGYSGQYNLATQAARQPGSSFKTFTLTAAVNEGMDPTIYINCNSPLQASATWRVQNFDNYSYGTLTLQQAFAVSSNTGFVQVIQAVGADNVVSMAQQMGITTELPVYDSITLGTVGIPVIQMAVAYSTIATGGIHRDGVVITRIEDRNGNTIYEHEDNPTQVVSTEVAQAVEEVMETVVTSSQGTAYELSNYLSVDQPVAGKTGTSENYRDLWFCGITPQLSVSVWCGYREEDSVYINGSEAHPSDTAVPIWGTFVSSALDGEDRAEFPTTENQVEYKDNTEWSFSNTSESVSAYSGDSSYADNNSSSSGYSSSDSSDYSSYGYGYSSDSGYGYSTDTGGNYGYSSDYGTSTDTGGGYSTDSTGTTGNQTGSTDGTGGTAGLMMRLWRF